MQKGICSHFPNPNHNTSPTLDRNPPLNSGSYKLSILSYLQLIDIRRQHGAGRVECGCHMGFQLPQTKAGIRCQCKARGKVEYGIQTST